MGKRKISKRKMAKIKAIACIVAGIIGAILVIGAIAYGVSRVISNKAEKIVQEKMNAQVEKEVVETEEEPQEPAVEIEQETEELVEDLPEQEQIVKDEVDIAGPVEEIIEEPQTEEIIANDKARIRSTPSTDGEILGTTKVGDKFTRYSQTDDGWSQIMYKDQEAYIKSDYVELYTGQDLNNDSDAQENADAEQSVTETQTAQTETVAADNSTDEAAKKAAEDAAKKAADEAAKKAAEDAAKKAAEAQQQTAPAPAAGGAHVVTTSDGVTMTVNDAQYAVFQKYWGYLGNVDETVSHHTKGDLVTLLQNEGVY